MVLIPTVGHFMDTISQIGNILIVAYWRDWLGEVEEGKTREYYFGPESKIRNRAMQNESRSRIIFWA
jgi:hypothetical protein